MRIVGLVLLLVAVGLFLQLRPPAASNATSPPAPPSEDPWRAPEATTPLPEAQSLITQRPLFRPERRPAVAPPAPDPVPDPPRVQLSAVSVSSDIRIAVIRDLESGRTRRIREGEMLNDWTVKRVRGDEIVLQWKEQQTIIPLSGRE